MLADPPSPETTSDYRNAAARPTGKRIAPESLRVVAEKLAFERVGILRLRILLVSTVDSEVFVDDTATVRLSVGTTFGKTFEAFDTYFDDGSCLMTWVQTPALTAQQIIDDTGRTGTGDFARDLLAHRTAVAVRTAAGLTALRIADVDAHLAIGEHYMLREIPLGLAWRYVLTLLVFVTLGAMGLAKILTAVARSF